MGRKPLEIKEIKDRLFEINPNIEILNEVHINSKTKLDCKCLTCGHEWGAFWGNLRVGFGCQPCTPSLKLTMDEIKKRVNILSPNIEILSDTYQGVSHKIKCRCKIDNYEWDANWGDISQGKGCSVCAGILKLDIETVIKRVAEINPNIEILSKIYVNSSTKMRCKCRVDGHEWDVTWATMSKGCGCPLCGNVKIGDAMRLTLEDCIIRLAEFSPNIKIISSTYKNASTKLMCECLDVRCGNTWETTWNRLCANKGCPRCNKRGVYNTTLAERHKEDWMIALCKVYLIHCWDDAESFYKIGITKNSMNKRFGRKDYMPYNYKVLDIIETNMYDAIYIEEELHKQNNKHSYSPNIKFGGHTECFSEILNFPSFSEVSLQGDILQFTKQSQ